MPNATIPVVDAELPESFMRARSADYLHIAIKSLDSPLPEDISELYTLYKAYCSVEELLDYCNEAGVAKVSSRFYTLGMFVVSEAERIAKKMEGLAPVTEAEQDFRAYAAVDNAFRHGKPLIETIALLAKLAAPPIPNQFERGAIMADRSDLQHRAPNSEAELLSLGEQLEAAWAAETSARKAAIDDARGGAAESDLGETIVDRIMDLKAVSPAGLRVKARAFMWTQGGNDATPLELRPLEGREDRTLVALLDDLLAIGRNSAAPA